MENTGWIKLHRSFLKWEWYNNTNTKLLFLHLLLKVNYENKIWHNIEIPKGSLITSYGKLAKELGLSIQNVRTCVTKLKSTNEITVKSTNKFIVVTIENWEKYQYGEVENNKQTNIQTNSKLTTTKEIKNININLIIKKYMKKQPENFREKMQLIRTIKQNENLNPAEETEIENYILMS